MKERRRFLAATPDARRLEALRALLAQEEVRTEEASLQELPKSPRLDDCAAVFLDADAAGGLALDLCRGLRGRLHRASCAVVLFGAGRGGPALVDGLDAGADDFWRYPFNRPVCLAYLRAILRRLTRLKPAGRPLRAGALSLDPAARRFFLDGREIVLRSKEFDLLCFLLRHAGQAVSRETLLEAVWGYESPIPTRTLDFHVSQLRRKLGGAGETLKTVAGVGYRLDA